MISHLLLRSRCRWYGSLLGALLLAGCDLRNSTTPAVVDAEPTTTLQRVVQLAVVVDPMAGAAEVLRPGEGSSPGDIRPNLAPGGASLDLVPVTGDHLLTSASCRGCSDQDLRNQVITVRFTTGEVLLTGVDFARTPAGEVIPTMSCDNCRVVEALLRGVGAAPLPVHLNPGDLFEAVLGVEAIEPMPFILRFDLVAESLALPEPLVQQTITGGGSHSCGLTREGRAYCWGRNGQGQLGDGTTTNRPVPTPVAGDFTFVSISAGAAFTIGVTTTGQALSWGPNEYGQLGDGTTIERHVPTPVAGNHTFRTISTGAAHAVGVTTSGQALAWGANRGRLGDGTTEARRVPTPVAGNHTFRSVSAGGRHTLGITTAGQALAWGENGYGELGDGYQGPTVIRPVPVPVAGNHTFISISAGVDHSVGLTASGQAFAWGANWGGQLGDGTHQDRRVPTRVAGRHTFRSLSVGPHHTRGLTVDGQAYGWGRNNYGQLGDGTTADRTVPTPVAGNLSFVSLHAGDWHTLAVTPSGQAYAWGRNTYGGLGDGTETQRLVPTPVAGNLVFK